MGRTDRQVIGAYFQTHAELVQTLVSMLRVGEYQVQIRQFFLTRNVRYQLQATHRHCRDQRLRHLTIALVAKFDDVPFFCGKGSGEGSTSVS